MSFAPTPPMTPNDSTSEGLITSDNSEKPEIQVSAMDFQLTASSQIESQTLLNLVDNAIHSISSLSPSADLPDLPSSPTLETSISMMTQQEIKIIDLECFRMIEDMNLAFPQNHIAWLTEEQISFLSKKQLSSLSPAQVSFISSKQIRHFSIEQILNLPEDYLPSFLPRLSTNQICELLDSSHLAFKESLLLLSPSNFNIIIHKLKNFSRRDVRVTFKSLIKYLPGKLLKSCTSQMNSQQVILASHSLPYTKVPLLLQSLTAKQEEDLLEETENLASQSYGTRVPCNFDKLSPAHIGVALAYETVDIVTQDWITSKVNIFSFNGLRAFLCQASSEQVTTALNRLRGDKYSFAIHHIKDKHLKEYVNSLSTHEIYVLLEYLDEKHYRVVFRDLSLGTLKELLPLVNSEYVSSAVRTLSGKVRERLLSPHFTSINNHLQRTDSFSPYILALAAYSRDETLWRSLLGRVPNMNFDQIMGVVPVLNRAQIKAIVPFIQNVIHLEAFAKSLNLWHIDIAIDSMNSSQKETLALKFHTSDDNLLLFLDEIPALTIAVGFLFEENKEKLLGLCSLMNSTQLHVVAKKMSAQEILETVIALQDLNRVRNLIASLPEGKIKASMELFEAEQSDIEELLNKMEEESLSLDLEIEKARNQVDRFALTNAEERDHAHFLEIRNLASSLRQQILHHRSVLRSWREYLQAPVRFRPLLPDDHPLHSVYAKLRWKHRKLSMRLGEQTCRLDSGNGSTGIILELQRLKPESVRKEDSEGCALKALGINGTNAWDSASVWKLYEDVRGALEEIAGGPEQLQDWDFCYEDVMEVGLISIQDFREQNIDSLEKLNEYLELKQAK